MQNFTGESIKRSPRKSAGERERGEREKEKNKYKVNFNYQRCCHGAENCPAVFHLRAKLWNATVVPRDEPTATRTKTMEEARHALHRDSDTLFEARRVRTTCTHESAAGYPRYEILATRVVSTRSEGVASRWRATGTAVVDDDVSTESERDGDRETEKKKKR